MLPPPKATPCQDQQLLTGVTEKSNFETQQYTVTSEARTWPKFVKRF